MNYRFKGRLCGFICVECPEPLSGVKVRLYRLRKDQDLASLAVAQEKDTFAILTDRQAADKAASLLAECEASSDGSFAFELGDKQKYAGEAFEIDLYFTSVPHLKPGGSPPTPLQCSITTIQPLWRRQVDAAVAAWEYCIPSRFWCAIRARFGAWTICGRVTVCDSTMPVMGVRVSAFDADWTQDDPLGTATTDANGRFRIDYLSADFLKTPFSPLVNVEWIGGPDLYFRVDAMDGTPLLVEPSSTGRTPGRENAGNCFCAQLCLKTAPTTAVETIPLFTSVGAYRVDPSFGDFGADGLTAPDRLAFTDTIPLMGILPDGQNPEAVEYRFRIAEYDAAGALLGAAQDVDAGAIAPTSIGRLEYWSWNTTLGAWEVKAADYWVNRPGAVVSIPQAAGPALSVSVNQDVKPGGWIEVPRANSLLPGGQGRFIPNGYLISLNTGRYTSDTFDLTAPAPGLKAGDSVPVGKRSSVHAFKLFFEARVVGAAPLLPGSNALEKIVLCNTHYTYARHPNWAGYTTTQRGIVSLDIKELTAPGAGCGKLQDHAHALYTVYHPFVASARLYFEGNPPLPPDVPLAIAAGESASGAAGHDIIITSLHPCAYVLWLEATLNLTSGWGRIVGATLWDHIAFCKG